MNFWQDKRVVVTGGAGFLGSYVVEKLRERGCRGMSVPRSKDYDLREKEAVVRMYEDARPDIVIHLAAVVGGIGANRRYPGKFFYDNAMMGIQLIEYARRYEVDKFVCVGTICAYPKYAPVPFKEDDLWNGYPEETNAPYGLAKKMLLVQLQAYRQQYGLNGIYLLPVNLYVEDAAEGIVLATERYNKPEPVNLGSGEEVKVKDLVYMIKDLTRFEGEVEWDTSKPNGQPRRKLDTSKAEAEFGFNATTTLREGLGRTVDWYVDS